MRDSRGDGEDTGGDGGVVGLVVADVGLGSRSGLLGVLGRSELLLVDEGTPWL